jgi:GNAT superfamily N-acetyltransferase
MNSIVIKFASVEDCPAMLDLIKELAIYEKAPDEVTVTLDEFVDAGFGKNPVWKAFIAVLDDKIVGMSLFYERYSTWKGRRLYLEDLVVTENLRKAGIGKLLFDATISFAKEKKYHGMVWQVLDWNEPAINFYKKYNAEFGADWLNGSLVF